VTVAVVCECAERAVDYLKEQYERGDIDDDFNEDGWRYAR
jgi:uncharacterized membrane protein